MTDLSDIFRASQYTNTPKLSRFTDPITPYMKLQQSFSNRRSQPQYASAQSRPIDNDLSISNEAKKIITFDNLQQQSAWFEHQNLVQFLIKISIICISILILYYKGKIGENGALSIFIFVFLLLGLQHNIFGGYAFRNWVYYSLIGTTIVLSNLIFLSVLGKISPHVAGYLFYSHYSLIPAIYISILVTIVFQSLPLLGQETPKSLRQIFLGYPRSVIELVLLINKLKIAIAQAYSIMLIITFIIFAILLFTNYEYYQFQELFAHILHPYTFIAQIITFLWIVFIMHFVLTVVSRAVSRITIVILFNQKNKNTRIPIILQLLKLSPHDKFYCPKFQWNKFPLYPLLKFFKFDFSLKSKKQRKITEGELENIYLHSLAWLSDLLASNPQALNTRINSSKFYHTYFDIFKHFSQGELSRCSNSLFELSKEIQALNQMRQKQKSIAQDLFFWPKVLKKLFVIWSKAVKSCKHLKIVGFIIQIISQSKLQNQLWAYTSIGRDLRQVNLKTQQLKSCKKLNPIVRQKMEQYFNKTSRILKQ